MTIDGEHSLDEIFMSLDETDKLLVLRTADVYDDRPGLLRRGAGDREEAWSWMDRHRREILPALLRVADLDDSAVSMMHAEGDFEIGPILTSSDADSSFRFGFVPDSPEDRRDLELSHLAAAS